RDQGGTVEEQDDLGLEIDQAQGAALEVGQAEAGRRLGRIVALDVERGEVRRCRHRQGQQQRQDEARREGGSPHFAPDACKALRTSCGSSRSSGLVWIFW